MKLWLLQRQTTIGWDEAAAFVIRATCETCARNQAANDCGDEGREVWLKDATCVPLAAKGKGGVILRDFLSG